MPRSAKLEFHRDNKGEWRVYFITANGRSSTGSTEGYKKFASCRKSAETSYAVQLLQDAVTGVWTDVSPRGLQVEVFK